MTDEAIDARSPCVCGHAALIHVEDLCTEFCACSHYVADDKPASEGGDDDGPVSYFAEVPADEFAVAWLNVGLARGKDKDLTMLHTVVLDFLDNRSVRLAAADGTLILYSEVNCRDTLTDDGEATLHLLDSHGRLQDLCAYVQTLATKAEKEEMPFTLRMKISVQQERLDAFTLFGDLIAKTVVVFTMDGIRVPVPTAEVEYPDWRRVVADWTPGALEARAPIEFGAKRLAVLGKFTAANKADEVPIVLQSGGMRRPSSIFVGSAPPIHGLISTSTQAIDDTFYALPEEKPAPGPTPGSGEEWETKMEEALKGMIDTGDGFVDPSTGERVEVTEPF